MYKDILELFNLLINDWFFGRKLHAHPVCFHSQNRCISILASVGTLFWDGKKRSACGFGVGKFSIIISVRTYTDTIIQLHATLS